MNSAMKSIKSILSGAAIITLTTVASSAADSRSYVAGNFSLELDGVKSGFIKSVSGGGISAEVISEQTGVDHLVGKHIGQPKYEEFSVEVGFGMSKNFFDWISDTLDGKYAPKNGSISVADYNYVERQRATFNNAL